jgi:hypothetical protein
MTRLSDVLKPTGKVWTKNNFDQYLWSYRFRDFIVMILKRNRGYISRKGFNLFYELLEISFLAFYCHPDFYASLLFIPFSSFFMNLIIEEVFSLNRSALFDNSLISKWINYGLIALIFIPFVIFTIHIAGDILLQHWILMTIFCSRIILLSFQAFSFAYSLEVISKKRVYFSSSNWWAGLVFAISSVLLFSLGLQIESSVPLGIIAIYLSRLFIEIKFVLTIKTHLQKESQKPILPSFETRNFILRFVTFAVNILTLFTASSLLKNNGPNYIWITFFFSIFLFRLINRPFRSLQIDFIKYFSFGRIEWIHFRHKQTIRMNMALITIFLFWFSWSTKDWNMFFPLFLLSLNINFFLALVSVGQDTNLAVPYLGIRLIGLLCYYFAPDVLQLPLFCVWELLVLWILRTHSFTPDGESRYLKSSKLLIKRRFTSLDYLPQFKDHNGQFALMMFNTDTGEHLKKMFRSNESIKPLLFTKTQWVMPIVSEKDHFELWKMYPRELRSLTLLSKNELKSYLPVSEENTDVIAGSFREFKKVNNRWMIDGKRVEDPGILKMFAEVEFKSANALCLEDRRFSFHFEGKYFYPLLNLGEVSTIIQTDRFNQKVLNLVKDKSWHTLKLYLFS